MKTQDYYDLASFIKTGSFDAGNTKSIFYRGLGQLTALLYNPATPALWPDYLKPAQPIVSEIYDLIFERYNGSSRKVIDSLKRASISSYFTPPEIAQALVSAINFKKIDSILDPSAGTGNFIAALPDGPTITALEPDPLSFEVLTQLYPGINAVNKPFEETTLSKYDLIISNIPFGSVKVFDNQFYASRNKDKIASTTRIHNYFFVKAVDHLNQQGLVAFIVSSAFADSPGNEPTRQFLLKHSTLAAIVRLPGEVFTAAGTKPTTDIIILEKRSNNPMSWKDKLFIKSVKIEVDNTSVPCNELLSNQADLMIGTAHTKGQYGNDQLSLSCDNPIDQIADRLKEVVKTQLQEHFNVPLTPSKPTAVLKPFIDNSLRLSAQELEDKFTLGNLFVRNYKTYRIEKDEEGFYLKLIRDIKATDRVMRIINLRILYTLLLKAEQTEGLTEQLRKRLNEHYESFHFQFGNLNDLANIKVINKDSQGHLLLSLENRKGKTFTKADIFTQRVTNDKKVLDAPKSLSDAIIYSLNTHNQIKLQTLEKLMGMTGPQIIYQGVEQQLIYLDRLDGVAGQWAPVTKDLFVSGDIYKKIEAVKNSFPIEYDDLRQTHLDSLSESLPSRIPFELIDINLGERWIDERLYHEFLNDFFQVDTALIYLISSDKYEIKLNKESNISKIDFVVEGKTTVVSGRVLMEHAFSDTTPKITYPSTNDQGEQIRITDHQAVRAAQQKIEVIYERFNTWMGSSDKWRPAIEEKYNRLFNNTVPRCYDGAHLNFESLAIYTPYDTQKNAVYRNLQQNGGINDHIVGAGKTLVMAISAHEMKRLGVANKPLIIAKNANVSAIYREFILAFPKAKVLHPEPKDFKPKNRRLLFQRIMNNDWDSVIISHEQFKMIPQSREVQGHIIGQELEALESDLATLNAQEKTRASTRQLKGLEKRKDNMKAQLNELEASIIRDPYLMDFEKMGFDHLFVDESQEFKNLLYTTRHSQVSGLGTPKGSQRAFNLLLACRTIQGQLGNVDKGITFLSGTTISNSLVELYLLFKYLRPNALERLQIRSFDAWAKVYARKSYEFEFGITNEVKRKERFREFIKVPELAGFYTEITDVVNFKNFTVDKPIVKNHVVNIPPTETQSSFMMNLVQFAKTQQGHYIGKPFLTEDEKKAFMLIATNLAKKMSLDMRLIDPEIPFEQGCKLDRCSQKVSEVYHACTPYKGTQLIFLDLSTPSAEKWNAYDELRHLLHHKFNIPLIEIAFIHEAKNPKQKEKLFEKLNDGTVRVIIGSTIKMGVGVNVQKRIIAMHHLDIPWRPSDFEQRTGRGGRPGNLMAKAHNNNIVDNYIYAVERSLDSYQFNLLSSKQKFIDQIKDNSIKARRIDEGSMAGEGGDQQMNFAEYVALLSGNAHLLEKVKVDKQLKDLEMQYNNFISEQSSAQWNIDRRVQHIAKKETLLQNLQLDIAARNELEQFPDGVNKPEKRYYYPKPVSIHGRQYYDVKEVGAWLLKGFNDIDAATAEDVIFGAYGPFKIQRSGFSAKLIIKGPGNIGYTYSFGIPNDNPTLAGAYIKAALDGQSNLYENAKKEITKTIEEITYYKKKLTAQFDKAALITSLKTEVNRLEKLIESEAESATIKP